MEPMTCFLFCRVFIKDLTEFVELMSLQQLWRFCSLGISRCAQQNPGSSWKSEGWGLVGWGRGGKCVGHCEGRRWEEILGLSAQLQSSPTWGGLLHYTHRVHMVVLSDERISHFIQARNCDLFRLF